MADKYNNTYGWDDDDPFKKDANNLNPDDTISVNNSVSYDTSGSSIYTLWRPTNIKCGVRARTVVSF